MVIWSFFDTENQSVAKAFPKDTVYCFGTHAGDEYFKHDLAEWQTWVNIMAKYPKPTFIFASPPCQSWLSISWSPLLRARGIRHRSVYWIDCFTPAHTSQKNERVRLNGCLCALYLAKCISQVSPFAWFVENPSKSALWKFIVVKTGLVGNLNRTNYQSYRANVWKPTTIFSNLELPLKKEKNDKSGVYQISFAKGNKTRGVLKTTAERVKVPTPLYEHIGSLAMHLGAMQNMFM